MRRLAVLVLLGLAACVPRKEPEVQVPSLRDPNIMISSIVAFDPQQFSGVWYVAQSGTPGCAGSRQVWTRTGGGWSVTGADCTGPRAGKLSSHVALTGPGGRFLPEQGFAGQKIWVLWTDAGYNIAVLGTPSGKFGTILSRQMLPRQDLLVAARRVLDFNGYDLKKIGR